MIAEEQAHAIQTASIEKVVALEDEVKKLPQVEMPPEHYFAQGVYGREITIPKGVVLVGRMHHQSQINFIMRGDISVTTPDGVKRVQGPCVIVSPAGTKRAGYAHEETVWITVLGTQETDPKVIEDTLTSATFEEFQLAQQRQLEGEE